jgi:hypothetical protein
MTHYTRLVYCNGMYKEHIHMYIYVSKVIQYVQQQITINVVHQSTNLEWLCLQELDVHPLEVVAHVTSPGPDLLQGSVD